MHTRLVKPASASTASAAHRTATPLPVQRKPLSMPGNNAFVIQRSDDPAKAMAAMERHMNRVLGRTEVVEDLEEDTDSSDEEYEEKEEAPSGIVGRNMGAYMGQVKMLEAKYLAGLQAEGEKEAEDMRKLKASGASASVVIMHQSFPEIYYVKKCDDYINAIHAACKDVLLPTLGAHFPKLKINKKWGDNEASFGSRDWNIEIDRPEDFLNRREGAVFSLSSTFLHETRHVEQDWIRLIKKDPNMDKRDKPKGADRLISKTGKHLPVGMDLSYMTDTMAVTSEQWTRFYKMMERHEALGNKTRNPVEEEQYDKIDQAYRAFPPEADAYKMEALYSGMYHKQ